MRTAAAPDGAYRVDQPDDLNWLSGILAGGTP
jgi:hypothetical protein